MAMASSFWKFIKSKVAHQDRGKTNELLAFDKGAQRGFPEVPTCLTVDGQLSLLAIGTALGEVHIYGGPGVELSYKDEKKIAVKQLHFIPNTGRIVALQEGGHATLLELNVKDGMTIVENAKRIHSPKLENVSVTTVMTDNGEHVLLVGSKEGEMLAWSLPLLEAVDGFALGDALAKHESITIPAEKKTTPGSVISISHRPNSTTVAVGFSTGIIVLYDAGQKTIHNILYHEELTNLSWEAKGNLLVGSFSDGSYQTWDFIGQEVSLLEKPAIPYGPYPCRSIEKIYFYSNCGSNNSSMVIFSGGLPRDRVGDHYSITIMEGDKHTALDFPSAIVDFFLIDDGAVPNTLIVLLQNQMITVDLTSEKYPEIVGPHLMHLFAPVTSFELFENVSPDLLQQLGDVGLGRRPSELRPFGAYIPKYSQRQWPFNGGVSLKTPEVSQHDLLITAHGDGSLRFWDASGLQLVLLRKLDAPSRFYQADTEPDHVDDSFEVWPPFRKYGYEEVAVSDPRLQIQKFAFDPESKVLAVGGKAGQVLLYQFSTEYSVVNFQTLKVQLVGEEYEYIWRGTQTLQNRDGNVDSFAGFQGVFNIQLDPPSEITALAIKPEWQLLCIGSGHGFALIDYQHHRQVLANCTMNPAQGIEATSEPFKQKAKRAGETIRRSLRQIPRPHLNMNIRSPTSYSFPPLFGHENNGMQGDKTGKTLEEGAELKSERPVASPTSEGNVNAENPEAVTNRDSAPTVKSDEKPKTVVILEETVKVIQAVPWEKAAAASASAKVAEPIAIQSDESPSPIIVDEALLQALEKDVMPVGLVEEEKVAEVKPEKVYNYESTTVRSVLFANSFLENVSTSSPYVWIGLNSGKIIAYKLELATAESPTKAVLSKELFLRHAAPVIFMGMVEHCGGKSPAVEPTTEATSPVPSITPVPTLTTETSDVTATKVEVQAIATKTDVEATTAEVVIEQPATPSSPTPALPPTTKVTIAQPVTSNQKLVVVSEEQIKIFYLPSLKPFGKYKLSNARFKKASIIHDGLEEFSLLAMNSRGEVDMYSLPALKRQLRANVANNENLNVTFGGNGHGLYQSGTSELTHFFLKSDGSPHFIPCMVELPEGARPVPPAPVVAEAPLQQRQDMAASVPDGNTATPSPIAVEMVELQDAPLVEVLVETVTVVQKTGNEIVVQQTETVTTLNLAGGSNVVGDSCKTLTIVDVERESEPLNVSMNGGNVADMSSDSIIDHNDLKSNGYEEDSNDKSENHMVYNLEEKLKAMEAEETAGASSHVTLETESY